MNLYNIQQEYIELVNSIIQAEGELTPEVESALQINKEDLEVKGINYGFVIRKLDYEIDTIDSEIKRLQGLKSARNNAIDRLKSSLSGAMMLFDINEIKTPLLTVNFRKSESIDILEEAEIPEEFIKIEVKRTPNKVDIKKAIKSGQIVPGAYLSINQNIQIK